MKKAYYIIIIVALTSCNFKTKLPEFKLESFSKSVEDSKAINAFISSVDLEVISHFDTIKFNSYGWIERRWANQNDSTVFINKQYCLIFENNDTIINCSGGFSNCNYEIYDKNWKTPGLRGDTYYYVEKFTPLDTIELTLKQKHNPDKILRFYPCKDTLI